QGFGFRDLAWDGKYLLTSDNNLIRYIDTVTFTEPRTGITGPNNPNRGLAWSSVNRIWTSNFTVGPVAMIDTNGVIIKSLGIPTVAPVGLGADRWTSRNKMWLWYAEYSIAGTIRLSKVDTATGAIVQSFNFNFGTTTSSGGLDVFNNHPSYPGRVIAAMVVQRFPTSLVAVIDLGPDSSGVTGLGNNNVSINTPDSYKLTQNYPNPFNPTTKISFSIPKSGFVTLKIYDLAGKEVTTLVNEFKNIGNYDVQFNGANLSSGAYFYRLESTGFTDTKKMMLIK
ncbi:MAG: T9SS type A sorting domain-containing protein, partial [bacterium]